MAIAKTKYAGLSQYVGSDIPKWVGAAGVQTGDIAVNFVPVEGTYNGDMQKIEMKFVDHDTRLKAIPGAYIAKGGVAATDLGANIVTSTHVETIETGSETSTGLLSDNLATDAVIERVIKNGAVTHEKIGLTAVQAENLADDAVDNRVLKEKAVETKHLSDSAKTDLSMPAGVIIPYAGDTLPPSMVGSWQLCNGDTYVDTINGIDTPLKTAIGTKYSTGTGSAYRVPDLRGRVVVGFQADDTDFNTVGKKGGVKKHSLSITELAEHTHTQVAHNHTQSAHTHTQDYHNHDTRTYGDSGSPQGGTGYTYRRNLKGSETDSLNTSNATPEINGTTPPALTTATPVINNAGDGTAHQNMQPYFVMNYIIKL